MMKNKKTTNNLESKRKLVSQFSRTVQLLDVRYQDSSSLSRDAPLVASLRNEIAAAVCLAAHV